MNKITTEELNSFIKKEAMKIIFEQEEESPVVFAEKMKKNAEDEIKRLKDTINLKQTSAGKVVDQSMKKSLGMEVQGHREQLKKAEDNKKEIEMEIQKEKEVERKEKELASKEKIEKTSGPQAVATTVMETITSNRIATPVLRRKFPNQKEGVVVRPQIKPALVKKPKVSKSKSTIVNFDKGTERPFSVKFTQRGFLIGDTRLSFELLEKAISKQFSITLHNGFILDTVRMQKILRYKDVL